MKKPNPNQNEWNSPGFLRKHWDAALYGVAATACIITDKMGYPEVSATLMCGSVLALAAEQFVFEKTRKTVAKSFFIAAMMGNSAYDIYQAPDIQKYIQEYIQKSAPWELAPPSQAFQNDNKTRYILA